MSQTKKERVLGKSGKKPFIVIFVSLLSVTAVVVAVIFIANPGSSGTNSVSGGGYVQQGNELLFPVSDFSDSQARYYSYNVEGKSVNFFLLKSSDGVIRSAFDACDVCFRAKKGYRQEGDFMICNNCGQQFASVRINEEKGGCNPSPLNREVRGDKVVINTTDLSSGAQYF